ncbi:MAG: hypothetical protein WCF12_06310 [Propionicimonas sp.]
MAELLRRQKVALSAAEARAAEALKQAGKIGEVFGLALYRKRGAANSSEFRTLFDALQTVGAELITHVGEPLDGHLEELADVVDWVGSAEGISPGCVAEAFEPEIRLNGRLVHRAKLICVLEDEAVIGEPPSAGASMSAASDDQGSDPANPQTQATTESGETDEDQ